MSKLWVQNKLKMYHLTDFFPKETSVNMPQHVYRKHFMQEQRDEDAPLFRSVVKFRLATSRKAIETCKDFPLS